jgi:hypothetical protein
MKIMQFRDIIPQTSEGLRIKSVFRMSEKELTE